MTFNYFHPQVFVQPSEDNHNNYAYMTMTISDDCDYKIQLFTVTGVTTTGKTHAPLTT